MAGKFPFFFSRLNILGVRDLDLMRQTAHPWPDEHTTLSRNERAIYFAQLRPYNSRPEGDRVCAAIYSHGTLIRYELRAATGIYIDNKVNYTYERY